MKDWRSQAHVKWDCKYHVVLVPKYRQKKFFASRRGKIGEILRQLCRQKGIELQEGHAMPDHIHLMLSVPPKYAIAFAIGYLKGKECCACSSGTAPDARNPVRASVLVTRLLCEHCGAG
jgi:putative transposase